MWKISTSLNNTFKMDNFFLKNILKCELNCIFSDT